MVTTYKQGIVVCYLCIDKNPRGNIVSLYNVALARIYKNHFDDRSQLPEGPGTDRLSGGGCGWLLARLRPAQLLPDTDEEGDEGPGSSTGLGASSRSA